MDFTLHSIPVKSIIKFIMKSANEIHSEIHNEILLILVKSVEFIDILKVTLYWSSKVERLFSSFHLHCKWTVFQRSLVYFYYITASLHLQQVAGG